MRTCGSKSAHLPIPIRPALSPVGIGLRIASSPFWRVSYINFFDDKSGQAKQVIVQVKGGYIGVNDVRDLKGVLEREKAPIGALITLREPTRPMLTEAAAAGFYEPKDFPGRYPRLQILTIAELLEGKKILYPEHRVDSFAKAKRKSQIAARRSVPMKQAVSGTKSTAARKRAQNAERPSRRPMQ